MEFGLNTYLNISITKNNIRKVNYQYNIMRSLHEIREYFQQGADVEIRKVLATLDLRDVVSSCTTHLPFRYTSHATTTGFSSSSSSSSSSVSRSVEGSYVSALPNIGHSLNLRSLKQSLGLAETTADTDMIALIEIFQEHKAKLSYLHIGSHYKLKKEGGCSSSSSRPSASSEENLFDDFLLGSLLNADEVFYAEYVSELADFLQAERLALLDCIIELTALARQNSAPEKPVLNGSHASGAGSILGGNGELKTADERNKKAIEDAMRGLEKIQQ